MIHGILEEPALEIYVSCSIDSSIAAKQQLRGSMQTPCTLEITLYGPADLSEEIGDWFQEYDVFLQDPRVCHRDTTYCNPQKMASYELTSCPMLSEVVKQTSRSLDLQVVVRPDLLDVLSGQPELPAAIQPQAISRVMKRSAI